MHDVVEGSNVTFSVAATGLRIRYEWMRFDRIDTQLTELEGARYVGVATSTLTIFSVQLGDTGAYVCTVTNSAGSVQSEEAQLTICKYYCIIIANISSKKILEDGTVLSNSHKKFADVEKGKTGGQQLPLSFKDKNFEHDL